VKVLNDQIESFSILLLYVLVFIKSQKYIILYNAVIRIFLTRSRRGIIYQEIFSYYSVAYFVQGMKLTALADYSATSM